MESRTKKTVRNTVYSITYKIVDLVVAFTLRTIFIRYLGVEYLGISGLFANIITVLSMMDLGVGGAIVFSLYKPLAENDRPKIVALMGLYKKAYNLIGILVMVVGIALTPFLKYLINMENPVEHLNLIYWITIANTAVTYFLAYKRSLLIADQRTDINTKNLILFRIIRFVALSICLVLTKNYLLYLLIDVCVTLASNIQVSHVINKYYSYLDDYKNVKLDKAEQTNILKYTFSGVMFKIGQTIVTSTDNIIISAFIGTIVVGIYSNYSMITSSLEIMIYTLFSSVTAAVGNFAVNRTGEEAEKLFKKIFYLDYVVTFVISICLLCLLSPFVLIWTGKSEYILSQITVIIIVVNFYIANIQKSVENVLSAVGELFYKNRFRAVVEGLVNLFVSISLVKFTNLGITGVFIGTTVCFIFGRVWMDAHTLYKNWFNQPFLTYLFFYLRHFVLFIITAFLCWKTTCLMFNIFGISLLSWLMCAVVIIFICATVLVAVFRKKPEYLFTKELMKKIITRKV